MRKLNCSEVYKTISSILAPICVFLNRKTSHPGARLRIQPEQAARLEKVIDRLKAN